MGETNRTQIRPDFNRSVTIAGSDERLTNLAGVVCLRELDEKLGLTRGIAEALEDPRDVSRVEHSMSSLLRSWTYTMAAHSCTQLSASRLAMDPALKLAASDGKGTAPLGASGVLASQPTLSRFLGTLGTEPNRIALNEGLFQSAARGIRAANKGKRLAEATLDIDSFPHEVHGHQTGAEYNGHYRMNCFHPLGVMVGETGHWVGLDLRDGNVHTANGAADLLLPLVDKAREDIAEKVYVRGDAGFPSVDFLDQLDGRDVRYAFRIPTNKCLQEWEEILAVRPPGRPPEAPRMWTHDVAYQASTWMAPRRVVVVVQERPGELYLHTFFILTSFTEDEMSADETVDFYRERALMENHIGEHQSVLNANLASSNRPKTHINRKAVKNAEKPVDTFGANTAALLLHGIAYNLANTLRCLVERGIRIAGAHGMHFKSVRRLFLAISGRFVISSRRITLRVSEVMMKIWSELWEALGKIPHHAAA